MVQECRGSPTPTPMTPLTPARALLRRPPSRDDLLGIAALAPQFDAAVVASARRSVPPIGSLSPDGRPFGSPPPPQPQPLTRHAMHTAQQQQLQQQHQPLPLHTLQHQHQHQHQPLQHPHQQLQHQHQQQHQLQAQLQHQLQHQYQHQHQHIGQSRPTSAPSFAAVAASPTPAPLPVPVPVPLSQRGALAPPVAASLPSRRADSAPPAAATVSSPSARPSSVPSTHFFAECTRAADSAISTATTAATGAAAASAAMRPGSLVSFDTRHPDSAHEAAVLSLARAPPEFDLFGLAALDIGPPVVSRAAFTHTPLASIPEPPQEPVSASTPPPAPGAHLSAAAAAAAAASALFPSPPPPSQQQQQQRKCQQRSQQQPQSYAAQAAATSPGRAPRDLAHPTRCILLRNIPPGVDDDDLRALLVQFGPLRDLGAQQRARGGRGSLLATYFDLRHARNAVRELDGTVHFGRRLDVRFQTPCDHSAGAGSSALAIHPTAANHVPSQAAAAAAQPAGLPRCGGGGMGQSAPSPASSCAGVSPNHGTLVVFNLDAATTAEEIRALFSTIGDVKEIRATPNKKHHKFVEFYDVRDAERAMHQLNKSEIGGKRIKIEISRPGGRAVGSGKTSGAGGGGGGGVGATPPAAGVAPSTSPPGAPRGSGVPGGRACGSSGMFSLSPSCSATHPSVSYSSCVERTTALASVGAGAGARQTHPVATPEQFSATSASSPPLSFLESAAQLQSQLQQAASSFGAAQPSGPVDRVSLGGGPVDVVISNRLSPTLTSLGPLLGPSPPSGVGSLEREVGNSVLDDDLDLASLYSEYSAEAKSSATASGSGHTAHSSCDATTPGYVGKTSEMHDGGECATVSGGTTTKRTCESYIQALYNSPRSDNGSGATCGTAEVTSPRRSSLPGMAVGAHDRMRSALAASEGFGGVAKGDAGGGSGVTAKGAAARTLGPGSGGGGTRASQAIHARGSSGGAANKCAADGAAASGHGHARGGNPAAATNGGGHLSVNNKYVLDLDKVRRGEETRTALMIRNIPNKYNQKMLLSTVEEEHKGHFDFVYLPIDFKNKCNVGYAFINFTKADFIVPFYHAFHGKKWGRFNSEKVCEITFARIQGRQQLIAHFQNSSLLLEDPKCRPVIFDGLGRQEEFPIGSHIRTRRGPSSRDSAFRPGDASPPYSPPKHRGRG